MYDCFHFYNTCAGRLTNQISIDRTTSRDFLQWSFAVQWDFTASAVSIHLEHWKSRCYGRRIRTTTKAILALTGRPILICIWTMEKTGKKSNLGFYLNTKPPRESNRLCMCSILVPTHSVKMMTGNAGTCKCTRALLIREVGRLCHVWKMLLLCRNMLSHSAKTL